MGVVAAQEPYQVLTLSDGGPVRGFHFHQGTERMENVYGRMLRGLHDFIMKNRGGADDFISLVFC